MLNKCLKYKNAPPKSTKYQNTENTQMQNTTKYKKY